MNKEEVITKIGQGGTLKDVSGSELLGVLKTFEESDVRQCGMGIWNITEKNINVLFTPKQIERLPDDFELECVIWEDGEKKLVKDIEDYDLDTRFGYTAFGFRTNR